MRVKRRIEHANDLGGFIADDSLVFLIPQNRDGDASGVVRVCAQIELVEEIVVVKVVAGGRREITVEGPAVFQHQRIHHRNRN
ncbi:hypothetical protein D3C71_1930380 [compost metagenome]